MNARPLHFMDLDTDERREAMVRVATRLAHRLDPAAAAAFAVLLDDPGCEHDAAVFRWLREP